MIRMKNLKKLTVLCTIVLVALTVFATKSSAFSKDDLYVYMTTKKDFTGTKLIDRDIDIAKLKNFFKKVEMTDDQAAQIRDYIEAAVNYMNEDGAKSPNKVSTNIPITNTTNTIFAHKETLNISLLSLLFSLI